MTGSLRRERPFLTAEWRYLVMLNYEIDPTALLSMVPAGTELDRWQGRCYVSLVAFRFLNTRVLGLPIPFHRDFDEINLRFYVRRPGPDGPRRGVVFIKEVVPRRAIAAVARWVYNENYVACPTRSTVRPPARSGRGLFSYTWAPDGRTPFEITAEVEEAPQAVAPGSEPEFITEHYWGYARQRDGSTVEYRVEHPPWTVWHAEPVRFSGPAEAFYGPAFAPALAGSPTSAFVATGSPVTVYRGTRL